MEAIQRNILGVSLGLSVQIHGDIHATSFENVNKFFTLREVEYCDKTNLCVLLVG